MRATKQPEAETLEVIVLGQEHVSPRSVLLVRAGRPSCNLR